jgi:phage gpG-like protein
MMRTGALRRGLSSKIVGDTIEYTNSQKYAALHNDGGTITVTMKMKKYFWAKYYEAGGKVTTRQDGAPRGGARNQRYTEEAAQWKSLALMKVGKKMTIKKRQFVGWDDSMNPAIERIIDKYVTPELKAIMDRNFRR